MAHGPLVLISCQNVEWAVISFVQCRMNTQENKEADLSSLFRKRGDKIAKRRHKR